MCGFFICEISHHRGLKTPLRLHEAEISSRVIQQEEKLESYTTSLFYATSLPNCKNLIS